MTSTNPSHPDTTGAVDHEAAAEPSLAGALGRALKAWPLLLALIAVYVGVAWTLGALVRSLARSQVGSGGLYDPSRLLAGIFELLVQTSVVGSALLLSTLVAAILGGALWLLLTGGVLHHLWRPLTPSEFAAGCLRPLAPVAVAALTIAVVRALLVAIVVLAPSVAKLPALGVVAVLWIWISAGYDRHRARLVLRVRETDGSAHALAPGPRGLLAACRSVLQTPAALAFVSVLHVVSYAVTLAATDAGLRALGGTSVLVAPRLALIAAVALGLLRLSVAVEWCRRERPAPDAPIRGLGRR